MILGHTRTRKGGIGSKQRVTWDSGCFGSCVDLLKVLAVLRDKSFEKGDTHNSVTTSSSFQLGRDACDSVRWSEANDVCGLMESNQSHEYGVWCPSGADKVSNMLVQAEAEENCLWKSLERG
jgi:hypothetical protein